VALSFGLLPPKKGSWGQGSTGTPSLSLLLEPTSRKGVAITRVGSIPGDGSGEPGRGNQLLHMLGRTTGLSAPDYQLSFYEFVLGITSHLTPRCWLPPGRLGVLSPHLALLLTEHVVCSSHSFYQFFHVLMYRAFGVWNMVGQVVGAPVSQPSIKKLGISDVLA